METVRREKKVGCVGRAKSLDSIRFAELTPPEIKILLSSNHNNEFATAVARQNLLADKSLFDPFKYFGSPSFATVEESHRFHTRRLNAMFALPPPAYHPRTPVKITLKASLGKNEELSPLAGGRSGKEGVKRTMGKSPKGYVKENKENFMRLNLNNMQKMRVKLKINKK
jgi:hypothetical protein